MPVINFCCLNPAKGDSKKMGDPQTMGETALIAGRIWMICGLLPF
jgi:hypothetical protein